MHLDARPAASLVREKFPAKAAVYAVILAPLIVPGIIIAIAVYFLFARLHMIGSPFAMALGQAVIALPLVVVIVSATLQGFDECLEQAAVVPGAGRVKPAAARAPLVLAVSEPQITAPHPPPESGYTRPRVGPTRLMPRASASGPEAAILYASPNVPGVPVADIGPLAMRVRRSALSSTEIIDGDAHPGCTN